MLVAILLAQQADPVSTGLTQYGPLGIFTAALLATVGILWRRLERTNEAERERADRLEAELIELYKKSLTDTGLLLLKASEIMRDTIDTLKQQRGGDR